MWKGRKVILRQQEEKDAEVLQSWYLDKEFRMLFDAYSSVHLDGIKDEIKLGKGQISNPKIKQVNFIVSKKKDNTPIGVACIRNIDRKHGHAEILIGIGEKDMRLAGYGVDIIIVLLDILFYELGFERTYIYIYENNKLGIDSFLSFGFKVEGKLRNHAFVEGKYLDVWVLGLLKEEYEELAIVPKWKQKKKSGERS